MTTTSEQTHEIRFYQGHLGRVAACSCGNWEMFCGSTVVSDEYARQLHGERHLPEVERDRERARLVAEMDAQLLPGESWVYLPYGRMRHIIDGPISQGYSWSRCKRQPDLFSAWLGTGSPREVDQLVKLPPCKTCLPKTEKTDG